MRLLPAPHRLASWLLPVSWLLAAEARAQTADPKTLGPAQVVFDEAVKAMDGHDYAAACPKLEEVVRLVPQGLGAKLNLAECYERAGRTASAWTVYQMAEVLAASAGQEARHALARQRAAALKPRLSSLVILVPPAIQKTAGLEVRRDGEVIGAPQWGLAVPVDRGPHEIVVTASGKRPWKKIVPIEAEGVTITIPVEPLEEEEAKPFWGTQRIAGAIAGGAGLIGLGVGAAFGLTAISKRNDAGCNGNVCPTTPGIGLFNDAKAAGNLSTGFFVAGGAVLATGAVLFLAAPGSRKAPSAAVAVWPGGMRVTGTW